MERLIKNIEFGLKVFYKLKYKAKSTKHSELPKVIGNIQYLESWLNSNEKIEEIPIVTNELFIIRDLLEKYYRNEFIKAKDNSSIEEYLLIKNSADFEFHIHCEMIDIKNQNSELFRWLEKISNRIAYLDKYNRFNATSVRRIINDLTFDEYSNTEISKMLERFFIKKLDDIFCQIHLFDVLGYFNSVKNGETSFKPSLKQIALFQFYTGDSVTKGNSNMIAEKFGHKSGLKLYQHYNFYLSNANRLARPDPYTTKQMTNKIKLFESVKQMLPTEKLKQIEDEIKMLENKTDKEN